MQNAEPLALPAAHERPRANLGAIAQRALRHALIAVVFVYLSVVLVGPLVALLVESTEIGLAELIGAISTPTARYALGMSFALVSIAVVVNAVVGTIGAIVIVRHRFPGRALISAIADLPLAVSPVMIGLAFILLFGRDGWFSSTVGLLGLKILFSFPGLLIATLFVTLPYTIREVAYLLNELGTSEEEAATTLGASPLQTFFRVTLPNIRLALGYGLLMTAARGFGEFGAVLVLGGSIAGKTQTATTFIHDAIEERDLAGAYGMALLLAAMSIGLLSLLELLGRNERSAQRSEVSR